MTGDFNDYYSDEYLHRPKPNLDPLWASEPEEEEDIYSWYLTEPQREDEPWLFQSGYYLPASSAGHSLIVGATGCGKSLLTYPSIAHACHALSSGGNGLVVLFDTKGDMYPLAQTMAQNRNVPLYYFNPTDPRANAWSIGEDINGQLDVLLELVSILIPASRNDSDPFWTQGAQAVAGAAGLALEKGSQGRWGLHDLYNACFADLPSLVQFLRRNPTNSTVIDRILNASSTKTTDGILMNLSVKLQAMQLAAAHQYHTPRKRWVSLAQAVATGGVMVIGQKQTSRTSTTPIMRAMFKRLADVLLDLPDYSHAPTYLYIDEFAYLGDNLPGIQDLLTFGRSKNVQVNLTVQSIDQVRQNYGMHGAETIINNCDFITLMRANSYDTAKWASLMCGDSPHLDRSYSLSQGGLSMCAGVSRKPRFYPEDFRQLKKASYQYGLEYVFLSPYKEPRKTQLSPGDISELQPYTSSVAARVDKAAHLQSMPLWNPNLAPLKDGGSSNWKQAFIEQFSGLERDIAPLAYEYLASISGGYTRAYIQQERP